MKRSIVTIVVAVVLLALAAVESRQRIAIPSQLSTRAQYARRLRQFSRSCGRRAAYARPRRRASSSREAYDLAWVTGAHGWTQWKQKDIQGRVRVEVKT